MHVCVFVSSINGPLPHRMFVHCQATTRHCDVCVCVCYSLRSNAWDVGRPHQHTLTHLSSKYLVSTVSNYMGTPTGLRQHFTTSPHRSACPAPPAWFRYVAVAHTNQHTRARVVGPGERWGGVEGGGRRPRSSINCVFVDLPHR